MSRKYLICRQNNKNCRFKVLDLQLDIYICNFMKEYWQEFNSGNKFGAKNLLSRACEWIQWEERRLKMLSRSASKETIKMLETLEIGDTLFWTRQLKEVKLLEKPTEFTQIVRVKCESSNGRIVEVPAYSLRKISKGSFYSEYFLNDTHNENRLKEIEHKARLNGFRAEVELKRNGYLIKIYGDSQQEVDEFVNLCLKQDFDISRFI